MRTANTNKKQSNWHVSAIDPDVEYLIEPLKNSERVEIANYSPSIRPDGAAKDDKTSDIKWISTMLVRATLKGTRGILDPDNDNKELEFKFHEKKLSKQVTIELCQREMYDKIPSDLLAEIIELINAKNTLSEEDEEDVNFSSDLSPETNTEPVKTAMETTTGAESKDEGAESVSEPT